MVVYVLNCEDKPLMSCSPREARKLLNSGKAKVDSKKIFTIKLIYPCADRVQEAAAGTDSASKIIGTAVISNGNLLYQGETILRGEEIKRKMDQRAMYRKARRSRKLRYRKPRFLKRRGHTKLDRLSLSVKHKIMTHLREKDFIESILPIEKWFVETASFDIHKISNPSVSEKNGKPYQKGEKLGYYNTKAFVLARGKYTCQKCTKDKEDLKLHVHKTPEKESLKLQKKAQKQAKQATEISILRSQLLRNLGYFVETFGHITKINREVMAVPKTHYNGALCIAGQGEMVEKKDEYFVRRLVSKGDYQQTKGIRSENNIPTGKNHQFIKFDLVLSKSKKILGFVKEKRSSGYFSIFDIFRKAIHHLLNITKDCPRLRARILVLTQKMEVIHGH